MKIPLKTIVETKPKTSQETPRKATISYLDELEDGRFSYTLEFEDGSTTEAFEDEFVAPEYCECGNRMEEVCFFDGTDSCFSCHELFVMEQTGVGVVLADELGRPYMKDVLDGGPLGKPVDWASLDEEIPF